MCLYPHVKRCGRECVLGVVYFPPLEAAAAALEAASPAALAAALAAAESPDAAANRGNEFHVIGRTFNRTCDGSLSGSLQEQSMVEVRERLKQGDLDLGERLEERRRKQGNGGRAE